MIVSHRGLLAAAQILIILLFGDRADAALNLEKRQPQPPSGTVSGPSPVYFQTSWTREPPNGPYALGPTWNTSYTVTSTSPVLALQGALKMLMLWTSATSGTPTSGNTYEVADLTYSCDSSKDTGLCSYDEGKTGAANMNLVMNVKDQLPPSTDGIIRNFFFCLATGVNETVTSPQCESFSGFFDINVGSQQARSLEEDGISKRQNALTPPTSVLPISNIKIFIAPSGSTVAIPTPSQISSSSPTSAVSSPSITSGPTESPKPSTSFGFTVSGPKSVTTTVQPDATNSVTADTASKSKSSSKLPTGAIAGIAVGGFILLLIAAFLIFFLCRRRQRKQASQPEQVLLTHNMNHSRDLMAEKHISHATLLSTSISEPPHPHSSPFDHLSVSAPYTGRAGPLSSPRRNPTATTMSSSHTAMSRGISDASRPISPRSGIFEQYHDEPTPVYGDARHIPQVYSGAATLQIPAPFLSEPGMTDEELTRLEDEERRIDEAILEAERRGQQRR